ncbi:histidine kinase dimerization/phosphoacceptor domain -containing protein [Mucilaginibacter sp. X4EP1]|uniref:tetratricopeptide repeat-containing sensor histidine kinase n=1 Tax=Mucilaginibacter sp. X4EP1 TaxID=2723092 RepID=UPI002168BE74|nr:histidine kinase dimerization/phosphoacceptor domain -containing protein [Mucilaginibacter sp. X4EP1]MCS3811996.1 two-component sensor histidine kinase [Mucilaginibacter sp. X4EP1]
MRKVTTGIILLFILYSNAKAQNPSSADSAQQFLSELKKTNGDNQRLHTLIKLGSYYLYKPGEVKSDLDSADLFLDQAKELSAKLQLSKIQNRVSFLRAEVCFERGDQGKARIGYLDCIDNYMRAGDKEGAAQVWFSLAKRVMYSSDSSTMSGLHGFEQALNIYTALCDKEKEADVLKYMGDKLLQQGKLEAAENQLQKVLSLYNSIGYKRLHYTYDLLTAISIIKGDFNKALYYALEMLKSIQATGDTALAYGLYARIGTVYNCLNDYEKSKYWYNRALINGAKNPELFYTINNNIISVMIREGKKKEALDFLLRLVKKRPPANYADKLLVAGRLARCYNDLGNNELAEKYYLESTLVAKKTLWPHNILAANKEIAEFYFSRKRYDQAGIYFRKVLAAPRGIGDVEMERSTYLGLFKTDSATGNYLSAIKNFQRYKLLTDSIFTVGKTRQITEIQLQYENDQKVKQLESKGKLQQAELQHSGTVRNFIIAGAGLLFLFLAMGYRRYRQKQSSNRLLQAQKQEINLINQDLQLIVTEKDSLLKEKDALLIEKDWLLKEINHRVKNNLHMVISLLESQADYLENDALKAIEISQHRIYAMSLIHQKLYQSPDIKMVDMDLYIDEFVQYLAESFGPPANISIRSVIEPLKLGISQAIPLGLILNEAVTNAFKYAFPDNKTGEITIRLKKAGTDVELAIADNGIGIRHAVAESEPPRSLGMELMRGLTDDLKGNITFDTDGGTRIILIFALDPLEKTRITGISPEFISIAYGH